MRSKIVAYQKFVVTLQGICWSYPHHKRGSSGSFVYPHLSENIEQRNSIIN